MAESLDHLVADGILEEVVARLKSGKEADIYLVQHAGEIIAAKVYKGRDVRNFRNNAAYKEGRQVRNSRTQRAMTKGSRFGQEASEDAWKSKEFDTLTQLHAAGVRVPQPVLFYEGVLLMEAVIDADGHPAQRLIDAALPPELLVGMYADIRQQVIKMLTCDLIHGDLSPYNVLWGWNGATLIDFPQVVGAAHNNQAEFFFARDLNTVLRFFVSLEPTLSVHGNDAREIWRAYQRRELSPDFVPTGKMIPGSASERSGGGGGGASGRLGQRPGNAPRGPQQGSQGFRGRGGGSVPGTPRSQPPRGAGENPPRPPPRGGGAPTNERRGGQQPGLNPRGAEPRARSHPPRQGAAATPSGPRPPGTPHLPRNPSPTGAPGAPGGQEGAPFRRRRRRR